MSPAVLRETIADTLRLARAMAPAAVLASGLLVPTAWGKPGDLDPSFGNVGRAFPLPDLDGPAWSVQALDDDDFFLGGGYFYDSYYYHDTYALGFTKRITTGGEVDATYAGVKLTDTEVMDVVVQPDGKVVGVGRKVDDSGTRLAVFRLDPGGALDAGFGNGGIAVLGTGEDASLAGTSVVLDSDGRIVVAGYRGEWDGELIVARFLADGTVDTAFATQGVFTGPVIYPPVERPQLLRTGDGRFRVTTTGLNVAPPATYCRVLGLTADGDLDTTFGAAGIADVGSAGPGSVTCGPLVQQSGGGLIVAGSKGDSGMLVRLVAGGTQDATFAAPAVAAAMTDVTALGVSGESLLVAGLGPAGVSGALVVRLLVDGELDALFGNAGSTWIDLPSVDGTSPVVRDMAVLSDGGALLSGADYDLYFLGEPFVARLLGSGGGDGPGVVGIERTVITATEQGQNAVVTVRRMGGASGAVSVAYQTLADEPIGWRATPGVDFTTVTGRLTWADGETADKQVTVPIAADTVIEGAERFAVVINDPQGGLGVGTRRADIEIAEEPGFLGRVAFVGTGNFLGAEASGSATVQLHLDADNPAGVSVTVIMSAGTATPGADYVADPITVTWPAGTSGFKTVQIPIVDDDGEESAETFDLSLADLTNGVAPGDLATATVRIQDDDQRSSGGGGGGWLGLASMLLLGVSLVWRRRLEPPMPLR